MANEIRYYFVTGYTLYAIVSDPLTGYWWNGSAFEAPLTANWALYPVTMNQQSTTGAYYGDLPAVVAGNYDILIYRRVGGSPAVTDGPPLAVVSLSWDSDSESTFIDVLTATTNIQSRIPSSLVSGRIDASVGHMQNGVVTEAAITTPAESAGRPTGILGMIRRIFEWKSNLRTRDRDTGTVLLRNAGDTATLESQTQSTSSNVDTQTKGV